MTKIRFKGDRVESYSSHPAGVILNVQPGGTYEVDAGFDHLLVHPSFEVVGKSSKSEAEDVEVEESAEKPSKSKKN